MKQLELDALIFLVNSSLRRVIFRYAPCVWRNDFDSRLVVFRCVKSHLTGTVMDVRRTDPVPTHFDRYKRMK